MVVCQKSRVTEMSQDASTNTTMEILDGFECPKRGVRMSRVSTLYAETPCDADLTETKCRKREAN